MPAFGKSAVLSMLFTASLAALAGAQQKECQIDENEPNQLARAIFDLSSVSAGGTKPEQVTAKLQDALKLVSEADPKRNPVGEHFVYGKVLVVWMGQPGIGTDPTRGQLGFKDNPTAKFDIVAAIDSAFSYVEQKNPECAASPGGTYTWRRQKGWVDLVNDAMQEANSNVDSAVVLANRSLQLFHHSPYGYLVLAQNALMKDKPKDALAFYDTAVAVSTDSTMAEPRRQFLAREGNVAADAAESATGADKQAFITKAKAVFDALGKDTGGKPQYADAAAAGMARVAMLAGDTAAIKATYAPQLANPDAFSYSTLMNAAVTAARADQDADATKLFEAAMKQNPYHRDVLFNVARMDIKMDSGIKALPVLRRLMEIDPSNSDNVKLMAYAYSSIRKAYAAEDRKWAAAEKAVSDSTARYTGKSQTILKGFAERDRALQAKEAAYADSARVVTDSAIRYNTLGDSMPVKVTFNEFTPTDTKATISGQISNKTEAEKTYTLKIDFLDKTGAVVTSQTVSVGPVKPNSAGTFSATGTGAGISAFKYAAPQ